MKTRSSIKRRLLRIWAWFGYAVRQLRQGPMREVKTALQIARYRQQAVRWLNANGDTADSIAAQLMFHLNHFARRCNGTSRNAIYKLKDALIEHFVLYGYWRHYEVHMSTHACWRCGGTGIDPYAYDEQWCLKCNGTGIYSRRFYHYYAFDVRGRTYKWHRPWVIERDGPCSVEKAIEMNTGHGESESDHEPVSQELYAIYYLFLHTYLTRCGNVGLPLLWPRLSDLPAMYGRRLRAEIERRIYRLRNDLQHKARTFLGLPEPVEELPF